MPQSKVRAENSLRAQSSHDAILYLRSKLCASHFFTSQKTGRCCLKSLYYKFTGYIYFILLQIGCFLRRRIHEMSFRSGCCCPQHEEWGFGQVGVKKVFAATYQEERFCGAGRCSVGGHKERKRKICSLCRERIQLQMRCEALEVS